MFMAYLTHICYKLNRPQTERLQDGLASATPEIMRNPGPLSTKRLNVLLPKLLKSRSREIMY